MYCIIRYLNPEMSSPNQPAGADPSHFYRQEDNLHRMHTPSPHAMHHYGFSSHYYMENESSILHAVNTTLTSIQKQLTTLEEKQAKTETVLTEIQNSFQNMKKENVKQHSKSRKSPPGLSVSDQVVKHI